MAVNVIVMTDKTENAAVVTTLNCKVMSVKVMQGIRVSRCAHYIRKRL